jgi:hypothetical protein
MKSILAVVADGNAGPVLTAALTVAQRFNGHVVGLHAVTTEYAVMFGGEMGFSISSEVDRTLEPTASSQQLANLEPPYCDEIR